MGKITCPLSKTFIRHAWCVIIFSQGVGRRVMEKQGWKEGEGLGNSQVGMAEALENEGQHPNCKRGFG